MTIAQQLEIDRLTKEIQDLRDDRLIEPFVRLMLSSIGTYLASIPYEQWPTQAVIAFKHASRQYPIAAELYMERLPDNGT